MSKTYVLPGDVEIVAREKMSATDRQRLAQQPGAYAVTRPGSRATSQLVEVQGALLLAQFRKPRTIVEAIAHYASVSGEAPEKVLEGSYEMLTHFRKLGFLVEPGERAAAVRPAYAPGETIGAYRVVRCVNCLEDSEVYRVFDPHGRPAALKRARRREDRAMEAALDREIVILQRLAGRGAPRLLERGEEDGRRWIAIEWIDGISSAEAAREVARAFGGAFEERRRLAADVARAYARLHAAGVLHGDIHPRNVLVGRDTAVTVIDFGNSTLLNPPANWQRPRRAGLNTYYDPGYAEAVLAGREPPPLDAAAEQYSLGVLLYQLVTGKPYLELAVDRTTAWRQMVEEPPRPFAAAGMQPWPAMEACLARALAKKPADRFADIATFADALETVALPEPDNAPSAPARATTAPDLLRHTRQRLGLDGVLLHQGLPIGPTASIKFGAAGIAYFFYRLAVTRGDADALSLADLWLQRARHENGRPLAFDNPELDMNERTLGTTSPYHTPSGLPWIDALISDARGDPDAVQRALDELVPMTAAPCANLDATLGLSATLTAATWLVASLRGSPVDLQPLTRAGDDVACRILEGIAPLPDVGAANALAYLGIAHGWAGILRALMLWSAATDRPPAAAIRTRLDQLAELAEPVGRGLRWRRVMAPAQSDAMAWASWCHGTSGHVHLWLSAHRVYRESRYLDLAVAAGIHASGESPLGPNLCCDQAGQAYAMLALHRATADDTWLRAAQRMARHAEAGALTGDSCANSLYKGDVGIALLAAEIETPPQALMPLFEIPA